MDQLSMLAEATHTTATPREEWQRETVVFWIMFLFSKERKKSWSREFIKHHRDFVDTENTEIGEQ